MAGELEIRGRTGLQRYGGSIYEELHPKLSGSRGVKVYQEMRDNDAIVGAVLFLVDMLIRQAKWEVIPASSAQEDQEAAEFVSQCKDDMSHTWEDFISEVLSMLVYGWSYFELVYKRREGPGRNPRTNSRFSDGRIGWRKIEIRAQDTLDKWEFDDEGGVHGMWQIAPPDYTPVLIPIEKALLFRTRTTKGSPEGRSILRNAYRSWYMKKRIETFEAIGVERDLAGLPVMEVPPRIMHPDASSGDKTIRTQLERVVSEMRRDEREGVVIPAEEYWDGQQNVKSGYKFHLLSSGGSRQMDTDRIIRRYESRMATTALAEFILLGMDKHGSFALASSKTNMFGMALGAWLDMIAATLNRYAIPRLMTLNGMGTERLPYFKPTDVEAPPLEEIGLFMERMGRIGLIKPGDERLEREVRRLANLPDPDEPEAL